MTRSAEFTAVVREGRRTRSGALVVHCSVTPSVSSAPTPRVGFVVSRAVGDSVVRHRVSRRLRAVTSARLSQLPTGAAVVVRALPASASATSASLAEDLDRALSRIGSA